MIVAGTVTCIAYSTGGVEVTGIDVEIADSVVVVADGGVEQPCGWVDPEKVMVLVIDFSKFIAGFLIDVTMSVLSLVSPLDSGL